MIEIKCPNVIKYKPLGMNAIFMAGGITGCPDWQRTVVSQLSSIPNLILINPRRDDWDLSKSSEEQITWEYYHLHLADYTYFWFPKEGQCAITLFELGAAIGEKRNIRVGVEPGYWRSLDVHKQVALAAPHITVVDNLYDLYEPVWPMDAAGWAGGIVLDPQRMVRGS